MEKKPRGRPKKSDSERKNVDLRIPVTEAQKKLIVEAAAKEGMDMAGWARVVLVSKAVQIK